MAHPNRVGIGETDTEFAAHFGVVFDDDITFAPDILGRGLDVRPNERFELATTLMIDHAEVLVIGIVWDSR